ncbi:MAG: DUF5723 family protein [Prolixibacteraceae bacterium]
MKAVNRYIPLFVLILMLVKVFPSSAQTNIVFYPLEDQFNSSGFNPAFLNSEHRFTFSIFPMGGTSIGYNNQRAIKELVSKFISGVTTDSDYKEILSSLTDHSTFNQTIESTLLNFTFLSHIGTLNLRINENENFSARIKGNASDFIIKTGIQSAVVGEEQYLPAQAMHYREYSLGYSTPLIRHRFKVGIRAKLYFGKSAFSSNLSGSITNESGDYMLRTSGKVNISVPETNQVNPGTTNSISIFTGSSMVGYLMNNKNPGIGVDLGFKYRITPRLTVSMSMMDLGKISWKSNLNSKLFEGEYQITNYQVPTQINQNGQEVITKISSEAISDSISNLFNLVYDRSTFSTTLPMSFYSGASYRINPKVQVNLLNKYVVIKDMNYNSTSLTASFNLNKSLSVNTGYAIIGNAFNNVPLAFLFKKDFGQIYFGTDNLAAFLLPELSDFAGFSFGTCFYLFKKRDVYKPINETFPYYKPRKISRNRNGKIKNMDWEL